MPHSALSLNEVLQRTGLDKRNLVQLTADGKFPAAIPLGPWTTGWSERDVTHWVQARNKPAD